MTQALMFDLDNTLYSESAGLELKVLERINAYVAWYLGLPLREAIPIRREGSKRFGTTLEWLVAEKGLTDVEAYFDWIHPEDETDVLRPDPRLESFLDSLPYPKIILTNSPMEHAIRILDTLGVGGCFERIYDIRHNSLVGKPHPESYRKALAESGLTIETTLFVDDLPKYIKGYVEIGGRAILKDEGDRFGDLGYERIRHLPELKTLLDRERSA
jgi:putative hydrolase of the HAD superfamily